MNIAERYDLKRKAGGITSAMKDERLHANRVKAHAAAVRAKRSKRKEHR